MKTYQAEVIRMGHTWHVMVPRVPGAGIQVRYLTRAEEAARDLIAFLTGDKPEEIAVEVTYRLEHWPVAAQAIGSRNGELMRAAAKQLADDGISVRDIGTMLGVSHARAAKLA